MVDYSRRCKRIFNACSMLRVRKRRIEYIEYETSEAEVACGPSHSAADFESGSVTELQGKVVQKYRFIPGERPRRRTAAVAIPIVSIIAGEVGLRMIGLVADDQIWKKCVRSDDRKSFGYVVTR